MCISNHLSDVVAYPLLDRAVEPSACYPVGINKFFLPVRSLNFSVKANDVLSEPVKVLFKILHPTFILCLCDDSKLLIFVAKLHELNHNPDSYN